MKKLKTGLLAVLFSFSFIAAFAQHSPTGAWKGSADGSNMIIIVTSGYFSFTSYTDTNFEYSFGGTWSVPDGSNPTAKIEFYTNDKEMVGKEIPMEVEMENGTMLVNIPDKGMVPFTQIDNGSGPLAGDWKITARENNGTMNEIKPGARKTVKILSGTRFQWIAINTETGEFFGTGGGTYTFKDGVYTEHIEFFSRDSSRIGASLSFNGKVEGENWDHSGKSSKGDPIHEIWSRQ